MSSWCILHLALCGYVFYVMYWRCYQNSTQVNVVRCLSCPALASASYNSPELLQRRNPPSQRSSTSGSISRRLRSSSPPPTAKSSGASSPANPITLRSTWLRQRGCTLVASLFYYTCYIYYPLSTWICSFSVSLKEKTVGILIPLVLLFIFLFIKHKTKR